MLSNELKNIIKLSKKTGDRIIVFDSQEPENTFVLMGISAYEKLINQENLAFNDCNKGDEKEELLSVNSEIETKEEEIKEELTEEDLTDKINKEISLWKSQENQSFVADEDKFERNVKPWSISSSVKQKAKEVE